MKKNEETEYESNKSTDLIFYEKGKLEIQMLGGIF